MPSTREALAGPAKIGSIEFYATGASGPGAPRRIIRYGGIGVDGQVTEDAGMDARVESLQAIVDEAIWIKLNNLKNEAKVVQAIHPLFGVMQARLQNVTYNAGPDDLVEIQVTLVEHGDPSILLAPQSVSLSGKTQDTRSAWSDLDDTFAELNALDIPSDLSSSIASMQAEWSIFDDVLDLAAAGDALHDEVAASFNDIAEAGEAVIDSIDSAVDSVDSAIDSVTDLFDYATEDLIYETLSAARGVVNTVSRQSTSVWQAFDVIDPVSIAEVALELIGSDDDETIQRILDRNQSIVDLNAVPPGTTISVPVTR